jgi:hypothetical protein
MQRLGPHLGECDRSNNMDDCSTLGGFESSMVGYQRVRVDIAAHPYKPRALVSFPVPSCQLTAQCTRMRYG